MNDKQDTEHKSAKKPKNVTQSRQDLNENVDPNASCSKKPGRRQKSTSAESSKLNYTMEQLNAVRRVIKSQNHYHTLNVKPDASTEKIVAAYRKLALVLHPDKNRAPGATEAFQALLKANDVLTDPTQRMIYDIEQREEPKKLNTVSTSDFDITTICVAVGLGLIGIGLISSWWQTQEKEKSKEKKK